MAVLGWLILASLGALNLCGVGYIMASVQDLKDQMAANEAKAATEREQAAERARVAQEQADAQTAEIQRLNDIIAGGGVVTQADLDALFAAGQNLSAAIEGIIPDSA